MNENILEHIKLCTYSKIVTLERGALFGEMALNEPNATRKATIITSSDSHFAVLNKKTFNNSIKMGAQRHMKETLQFFIEIPIFNGIPEGVFYNKYYTNLSKEIIVKGKNVINQGEKPDHITLLQTGSYGLTTQITLYDLTRLILYYADVLINQTNKKKIELPKNDDKTNNKNDKNKANEINKKDNKKKDAKKKEEKKNKLNDLNDLQKLLSQESALLAESISFKKYYFTTQHIRINEIYCPEFIINDEYIDENGVYAFTIEAKSPENTIYTLDNKFLVDINEKNISIQKNKEKFLKQKMDLMIKRLLIIRNSLINSFFDSKAKKEIGLAVVKELEDAILLNLKKKRLLNKKEEIITNSKETNAKEKLLQSNLNSSLGKNKNMETGRKYRNTEDIMKEKNNYNNRYNLTTYKTSSNKTKSNNLHESNKYENDSKEKLKNNKSANTKLKLKPLNVSLKTAIMYTNRESEEHKKGLHSRKTSENIKNIKNYDEGLLFILNVSDNNKYSKTNYNFSSSRNCETKIEFKPFTSFYGDNNFKSNNLALVKTNKVFMNNLIWEKMKTGGHFPIKLNIYDIINNNYENSQTSNGSTINSNYNTYYSHKGFYNRNPFQNYYNEINNSTKKSSFFPKDFSFNNIQIENQNNLCFLSTKSKSKHKKNKNNKSYSPKKINIENNNKFEPKPIQTLKSFKKNEALLKMKMKNIVSPEEIQFMRMNRKMRFVMDGNKYTKVKEEKFKSTFKHYFKRNIVNRINYFYGKVEAEKK